MRFKDLYRYLLRALIAMVFLILVGCSGKQHADREYGPAVETTERHAVEIHQPDTVGVLDTDIHDVNGLPVGISCTTCHGDRADGAFVEETVPDDFHGGLKLEHGSVTCDSCHAEDRTQLHLANGSKLDFDQAMNLCAQCHGVQYRDYQNGSHGGMTGYWDTRRGPRQRNSCLDCHSPHSPAYSKVMPVHPPKDRFLEWKRTHEEKEPEKTTE
jgi:hypothetical protein